MVNNRIRNPWDDDLSTPDLPAPAAPPTTTDIQDLLDNLGRKNARTIPSSAHTPANSAPTPSSPYANASTDMPSVYGAAPKHNGYDIEVSHLDASEVSEVVDIDDLLKVMLEMGGSDLHLAAKKRPVTRVNGDIETIDTFATLTGDSIKSTMFSIMSRNQQNIFEEKLELDFAYELQGVSRFRVNVLKQQGTMSAVFRAIPWEIKTFDELGLPEVLRSIADVPRGLTLVTGPTGSGKSTTLAAMIDHINRTKKKKIITIEDPIEFAHDHHMSIITQREIGRDTHSYAEALKHALRQDPDIILVGEMRDLETISVALGAAETGHAVFATLHTQSAQETITRIVDVFPEGAKAHVQTQLSASLQAIVCQTLLKRQDTNGRVAALEILLADTGIRAMIRDGKLHQIQSAIQTNKSKGMQTLDSALSELVISGKVDPEEAAAKATDADKFIADLGGKSGIARLRLQHANKKNEGGILYGGR